MSERGPGHQCEVFKSTSKERLSLIKIKSVGMNRRRDGLNSIWLGLTLTCNFYTPVSKVLKAVFATIFTLFAVKSTAVPLSTTTISFSVKTHIIFVQENSTIEKMSPGCER